jgi:FkbM family methyltransferase
MFRLLDLLDRPPTIVITDVGAMSLGAGTEPYEVLLGRGVTRVIGFEPVEAECEKLNRQARSGCRYLPYAIGDGSLCRLHITNTAMTSSLYPPNTALLEKFQNLAELVRVVREVPVQTHRLDDLPEVAETDFLKLDVQGAELDVIRGAPNVLAQTAVVQVEVEFLPLYSGQPLFADVDQPLRKAGFMFHWFLSQASRVFKPLVRENNVNAPGSQLLWADAVYVKDLLDTRQIAPEMLLKLAVILHDVYASLDSCAFVLQRYDSITHDGLLQRYYENLMGSTNARPGG